MRAVTGSYKASQGFSSGPTISHGLLSAGRWMRNDGTGRLVRDCAMIIWGGAEVTAGRYRFFHAAVFSCIVTGATILVSGLGVTKIARNAIISSTSKIFTPDEILRPPSIACEIPQYGFRGALEFLVECQFPTSCGINVRSHVRASLLTGARIGPDPIEFSVARVCAAALTPEARQYVNENMDQGG